MTLLGFDSYYSFNFAREFVDRQTGEKFPISRFEKIGDALAGLILKPLDTIMKEFRNPVVIVALTITLLFIASIIFYPVQSMAIACRLLPFLKYVRPAHIKAALYVFSQTVILGLGLRSVSRLSNPELMNAFQRHQIIPIPIGAVRI